MTVCIFLNVLWRLSAFHFLRALLSFWVYVWGFTPNRSRSVDGCICKPLHEIMNFSAFFCFKRSGKKNRKRRPNMQNLVHALRCQNVQRKLHIFANRSIFFVLSVNDVCRLSLVTNVKVQEKLPCWSWVRCKLPTKLLRPDLTRKTMN